MKACSTHLKVNLMKKPLLLIAALAASSLGFAQEVGRVISATPVLEQVGVPRQVCSVEQVQVQQRNSGAGAVMGAIAGGAMGNAVGDGSGRAVATMIGLMGGAILGDRIEGGSATQLQNVQRCSTQTFYENRTVAYNVVYEYAGKRYQTQMSDDPGATLRLNISPMGTSMAPAVPARTVIYDEPVRVVRQAPVMVMPTVHLQFDNRAWRQPHPVVVAQVDRYNDHRMEQRVDRRLDRRDDRQDDRRDDRRDDWQNRHRDWRDGR